MIRLAISGAEERVREIMPRLRGGTAQYWNSERSAGPPGDCSAVVLLEPRDPSAELAKRCLAAEKHVLLSAEAGLSRERLASLEDAAIKGRVQLAVMNPDRFLPSRQLVRQELDAGKMGGPGLVRLHRWEPLEPIVAAETQVPSPLLCDLDIALWLVGKLPDVVYAVEHGSGEGGGRFLQVHLGFPGGAMSLIDYSSRLPAGEGYRSLHVIGSSGAAYADDHQNMQLLYRGGQPRGVQAEEGLRQGVLLVQDFIDGLAAQRDFSPTIAAWRSVLAVAEAALRSLQSRQAVPLEGR